MNKNKTITKLTVNGLLLAVATVLGALKIPITQLIELRFGFLPLAVSASLFGPLTGLVFGGLSDILGYLVRPTGPFFPGFTISAMVSGCLYGLILYRKELKLWRLLLVQLLHSVIVSMGLNTLWLSMLYGKAFIPVLTSRLLKTVLMFPVNTLLLWVVLKLVLRLWEKELKPVSQA